MGVHADSLIEGSIPCSDKELQLKPTLLGGQCFRWNQVPKEDGDSENIKYRGVFNHNVWTLTKTADQLVYKVHEKTFKTSASKTKFKNASNSKKNNSVDEPESYENILSNYLRLDENLEKLYSDWSSRDPNFQETAFNFHGIRVLKQDPVENVFSFICSTNNNIVRITSMVEKLCRFYGEKLADIDGNTYYDFPKVSALAEKGVEEKLRKEGFGYRAKYVHNSAIKIMENGGESWLKKLQSLPYKEAKEELMTLTGIGAKVADCICLMSMNHLEAIPVDTHVFQISQRYLPHLKSCKTVTDKVYNEIVEHFQKLYGEYAGWAHSVLFCADLRQFQSSSEPKTKKTLKGTKRRLTE